MLCTPARRSSVSAALLLVLLVFSVEAAQDVDRTESDVQQIQGVVNELAKQLGLSAVVNATVVDTNPLLVSVEPEAGRKDTFILSFENDFLSGLDAEGLRAVVAHELGHVWIFTHHPFLQTERLANSVAMRVVSRESLENVYSKVWQRGGTKGDIAQFLGQ